MDLGIKSHPIDMSSGARIESSTHAQTKGHERVQVNIREYTLADETYIYLLSCKTIESEIFSKLSKNAMVNTVFIHF